MRTRISVGLLVLAGCVTPPPGMKDPKTDQVGLTPFSDPAKPPPTRVSYNPASPEVEFRVMDMKQKLIGDNPQVGLKPFVKTVSSPDPEIFHKGLGYIYITDSLVKKCDSDALLAAVIANELGKMVAEREKCVADQVRSPEPLPPAPLPIGSLGNSRDADPNHFIEMAMYEKAHPRTPAKVAPVNPQAVARMVLEKAGFQRTDLDAALPLLQNAEGNAVLSNQFNGPAKQGDWKPAQ